MFMPRFSAFSLGTPAARKLACGTICAIFCCVGSLKAQEPPAMYGNIRVHNQTDAGVTIIWGWHGKVWQKPMTIGKGENIVQSHRYNVPGQPDAPAFLLGVYRPGAPKLNYHAFATPHSEDRLNKFTEIVIEGTNGNYYIRKGAEPGHWDGNTGGWTKLYGD